MYVKLANGMPFSIQKLFNETMKLQMEEFKKKQEAEQGGSTEIKQ
jgi:hypothetical protein